MVVVVVVVTSQRKLLVSVLSFRLRLWSQQTIKWRILTYIHGLQQPTSNLPTFQQSTPTTKLIIQKATEGCFQKKAVSPTTQGSDYLIYSFIWQSSETVWVGQCFFWYRSTRVVPDQRPLNGCVCLMKCNDSSCSSNNRCLQCFDAVGWA